MVKLPFRKSLFPAIVLLTISMGVVVSKFEKAVDVAFIDHPQFGYFEQLDSIMCLVNPAKNETGCIAPSIPPGAKYNGQDAKANFILYFWIDFIWAALLLLWINLKVREFDLVNAHKLRWLLPFFSILAYVLDVMENIDYMTRGHFFDWIMSLKWIASAKVAAYAIVLALVTMALYLHKVAGELGDIWKIIKASLVSILTIGVLALLSTKIEQGSTVIIHLLQNGPSLPLAILLINLLALAGAHYPDYLYKYFYSSDNSNSPDAPESLKNKIEWHLFPMFLTNKTGLGLVYYIEQKTEGKKLLDESRTRQLPKDTDLFDFTRKVIGGLLLVTWMYVLLDVSKKFLWPGMSLQGIMAVLLFLFVLFNLYAGQMKSRWSRHFQNNIVGKRPPDPFGNYKGTLTASDFPAPVPFLLHVMLLSFLLTLAGLIVAAFMANSQNWVLAWWAVFITGILNIIWFVLFQHFRSLLSIFPLSSYWKWIPIVSLKSDSTYLKVFAGAGLFTFLTYAYFIFNPVSLNALVYILMWLYLVYGLIVILIKHRMYYLSNKNKVPKPHSFYNMELFFTKYFPITGIILLGWFIFAEKVGNGLHRVPTAANDVSDVSLTTYCEKIDTINIQKQDQLLVASYGGGLRATAWTMLLLEHLQDSNNRFLDKVIGMSGVSGGFLGLSMYEAVFNEHHNPVDRQKVIDAISKHNLLGIDISYLLVADLVREAVPYMKHLGKDRAIRSMKEYSCLIQSEEIANDRLFNSTYQSYWKQGYDKHGYMPVLIGNTTGTHGRAGVAFSIPAYTMNDIFPGADDILDLKNDRSLTYLGATSTTERFPIFSPAAQVEGKGQYVDGGYFENSGLLSLMNFYNYVDKHFNIGSGDSIKIVLFINSKEDYVKHVLGNDLLVPVDDHPSGEFSAILETVGDINILPQSLESRLKNKYGDRFIRVFLPYPIQEADVIRVLGDKPMNPTAVSRKIKESNDRIELAVSAYTGYKQELIPPALARVLSDPAVHYMKAMLNHEEIKTLLKKINRVSLPGK